MSENTNAPQSNFSKGKRPTPKPKQFKRIASKVQGTMLGRFFTWLRTPEHKWEFGIKVVTLVVAVVGTWLLLNQNELLKNQNDLIQHQMSLEEANRRSALIVLMSNIMDKVDREIEEQKRNNSKDTVFSLSQSLVGQIAALSHSFKPYRYLDGDTLISKPLSPERGQLLITLTRLPLDSTTFRSIYAASTFKEADLQGANLGLANLEWVKLSGANLSGAILSLAYMSGADLSLACMMGANLNMADLSLTDLSFADLSFADLGFADLSGANLSRANLSGVILRISQAEDVASLYDCKRLHDSIATVVGKTHPQLFEKPKE